jgi:hypothetical protein
MSDSNAYGLFRLDVSVYVNAELAPLVTYLVRAEDPAAAAGLVVDRATESWPEYKTVEVLRCWSYPPGELVLSGAQALELSGAEPVPVLDVGAPSQQQRGTLAVNTERGPGRCLTAPGLSRLCGHRLSDDAGQVADERGTACARAERRRRATS